MYPRCQQLTVDNQLDGEVPVESVLGVAQSKGVVPSMLYVHIQDCEFVPKRVGLKGVVHWEWFSIFVPVRNGKGMVSTGLASRTASFLPQEHFGYASS